MESSAQTRSAWRSRSSPPQRPSLPTLKALRLCEDRRLHTERNLVHRHGCEPLAAELSPGSAILWHANTLHRSLPSAAAEPRWTLICCYNTRHNTVAGDPYHRTPFPRSPQAQTC